MQVNPEPTPRTTNFWQEKLDKKDLSKEKVDEIFQETIEYFKRERAKGNGQITSKDSTST